MSSTSLVWHSASSVTSLVTCFTAWESAAHAGPKDLPMVSCSLCFPLPCAMSDNNSPQELSPHTVSAEIVAFLVAWLQVRPLSYTLS